MPNSSVNNALKSQALTKVKGAEAFKHSNIYVGRILHKRFSPKRHSFDYRLYMLALDVGDVEKAQGGFGVFGFSWYRPLRFVEKDYLPGDLLSLSERIKNKVQALSANSDTPNKATKTDIKRIVMLAQVRCFGIYFSPANFYFCYDQHDQCTHMLAEVSNTPWNERHYYLVDLLGESAKKATKKVFQVSPFMDLDMTYFWRVTPPKINNDKLLVHIENKRINDESGEEIKLFQASLLMKKKNFTQSSLLRIWLQLPAMTIKVVLGIYWQALRLFIKRVPFIGYQKAD